MSVCILYILMGGGIFMTPGCATISDIVYPDKIVYTTEVPLEYSYVSPHMPLRHPQIVYRDWRPLPHNHGAYYPNHTPKRRHRRNITLHRQRHNVHKVRMRRPIRKIHTRGKKKHFKKAK